MNDCPESIERGNHKPSLKIEDKLMGLVSKDIKYGYQFPISLESANKFKHGVISPYVILEKMLFS